MSTHREIGMDYAEMYIRMGKRITIILLLLVALALGITLSAGCGAEMTVQKKEPLFAQPSEPPSAAVLSGGGLTTGGEHYKAVQTVGGELSKPNQSSEDGKYSIR